MVVVEATLKTPGQHVDEQVEDPVERGRNGEGIMLTWEATSCLATLNISMTPMENASEVSLTSVMTSLVMDGRMRLTTCGSTIRQKVCAPE